MNRNPSYLPVLVIFMMALSPSSLPAAENAYDVIGKTLLPWVDLLLPEPRRNARALLLRMHPEENGQSPVSLTDASVTVYLQVPDKLRVEGSLAGQKIVVCRRGQKIWAWPGRKIEALLAQGGRLPAAQPNTKLPDFEVPLTATQAAFLPALLDVEDGGFAYFRDGQCRKLSVSVLPEVADNIDFGDWSARIWVGATDYKIRKLDLRSSGWRGTIVLDEVRFLRYLKPEAWVAGKLGDDVLQLSPARFNQLTKALFARGKK